MWPQGYLQEREARSHVVKLLACPAVLIIPLALQPAVAKKHVSDAWQYTFRPYGWALTASGNATVKGTKSDVDLLFRDIFDALNIAFMVEAEAPKNRWVRS